MTDRRLWGIVSPDNVPIAWAACASAGVMAYSEWNPDNQVSANITTAKTVDGLRHTSPTHVILSVEEARQRLANGEVFNLSPLCGGIPPELACHYLKRFAELG